MEYVAAGDARIPKLGLGTWQNTGPECVETVRTALELGYRHVDTAQAYDNERAVGDGIAAADVDRDDVFVTTKLDRRNLRSRDVHASVRESLDRLGLTAVDLLLIHWPRSDVPVEETLDAMARLRGAGLVEHVGVSNFTRSRLADAIRSADAPVVADQVLYHPYKDQSELREFCVDSGVALTAYSPLARGEVVDDELLARIGEQHDKTAAQVALRWLVQQENVVAIPKTTSEERLAENLAVFDFSLSGAEMRRIADHRGSLKVRFRNVFPSLVRQFRT